MGYRVGLLLHVALARERDVREGDRAQKDVSSTSLEVGAGGLSHLLPPSRPCRWSTRQNGSACGSPRAHHKVFGDWVIFLKPCFKRLDPVP